MPALRTPEDECYEEVAKVLAGDRSRVVGLPLAAGDLQFFLGRFSLHRVTPNLGSVDRLLLIMSFAEAPGMIGSKERVMNLYGKTTKEHEQRQVFADGLSD